MLAKPTGIPTSSGCYLFSNAAGVIIYVGKAKSLRSRLANYFQPLTSLDAKTYAMVTEATSLEWVVTPSELDALILESELIKTSQPRYNIRLKDDKTYPYIAIDTRSQFPAPYITRSSHVRGVHYYGPYPDVRALRTLVEELTRAFPLRSCTSHKFKYHQRIARPCLLYDIGKCSGPCAGLITPEGYSDLVHAWEKFLSGDVTSLRRALTQQMTEAASAQRYEAAASARDALAALDLAAKRQVMVLDSSTNLDAIALAISGTRAAFVLLQVRSGRVIARRTALADLALAETPAELFQYALSTLYPDPVTIPATIVVESELASHLATEYLSSLHGGAVHLITPSRGRRRALLDAALADAASVVSRDTLRRTADFNVRSRALQELGAALGLESPPYRVECFDMSHLQGTNYVGSMVVFEDALPLKKAYRHFTIRDVAGNNDVAAMQEVFTRRLRYLTEAEVDPKFARPDLIIVDGGLPQLHAAMAAAASLGLTGLIELAALAKREELLYRPGSSEPIILPRGSEPLYLVQRLRDESHRFAITFHRSKRGRATTASVLDTIPGLGPTRRTKLLTHFGTLDTLRAASLEELQALTWLPSSVAGELYAHLHPSVTA